VSLMIELRPEIGAALVVGGGAVAARKVNNLLEAGFDVTVISPQVEPGIKASQRCRWEQRAFAPGDTQAYAIVLACTNDRAANASIGREARGAGKLVLVADSQDESTFFTPAMHRDGDLAVAISTGGASPTMAREIRDRVVESLGDGWADRVALARQERSQRTPARQWEDDA
jgi:siroheme synthase-like protein